VAVDDATRLAYVEVLPDEAGVTCVRFLWRALAWFRRHGIRVRRLMTDNGPGYRAHVFTAACAGAQLRHLRTRPYTPRTNGKAERFIQTLLREWAYPVPYASSWRRTRALRPWLRHYNVARPHAALGYQPPCVRFPRLAQ
jgi:transposase InsO family protein